MRKIATITLLLAIASLLLTGCGFITPSGVSSYDPPGFFPAFWHGLIAPYSLIVRWFTDVKMYAIPNNGWFYDFGFFLGIILSGPIGWLAAIISIILLFF